MVYPVSVHQGRESTPPHPRGVSHRTPIDAAKEKVTVLELAERLASEQGKRLTGRGSELSTSCLLPSHDDGDPSFYVNPERNVWFCHSCQIGGDVVRLAQLAWGYPPEQSRVAAAELLMMFGHEIPQRPLSYFRRQERQKPVRDAIGRTRFDHLRRRLMRRFFEPSLAAIRDPEERETERRIFWDATEPLARMLVRDLADRRSE